MSVRVYRGILYLYCPLIICFLLKVFVGGLDPDVNEDDLKEAFSRYGEVASVKIPVGKQCGFVLFVHRYILLVFF